MEAITFTVTNSRKVLPREENLISRLIKVSLFTLNPDSAIESYMGSLGRPLRSEANSFVPPSRHLWPVHGVAISKRARCFARWPQRL